MPLRPWEGTSDPADSWSLRDRIDQWRLTRLRRRDVPHERDTVRSARASQHAEQPCRRGTSIPGRPAELAEPVGLGWRGPRSQLQAVGADWAQAQYTPCHNNRTAPGR